MRKRIFYALAFFAVLTACGSSVYAQYGLTFNGSNQYVTFGAATSTLGVTNFTLEAWVKRAAGGVTMTTGSKGLDGADGRPQAYPVLTKGMGEGETPANINTNFFLGITSTGFIGADFEDHATGLNHPVWGVTTVPIGEWHHIAATYDGRYWNLYLDGVLDKTLDLGAAYAPEFGSIQHAALAVGISSTGSLGTGRFSGMIDEARVWDVVRTQQEIADNMALEVTSGTGLKGRWGLNDGSGSSAVNSVALSPNGTLTNSPTWTTPGAPIFGAPLATAATSITGTGFSANWNAVSGATDYRLDVSTSNTFGTSLTGYENLTVAGTTQNVTGLSGGTTYYYRVRAVGTGGTSANSNVITAATLGLPPSAPSGLTATPTTYRTIALGWTDNSGNEQNFQIDRSTDGGSSFALLATLAADANSYTDATVGAGLEYCYRVRATNLSGNSDYTTPQCATTPSEPNTALRFGSGSAYVTFGQNPALGLAQFTLETWFKREGTGSTASSGGGGVTAIPLITKGLHQNDGGPMDANYFFGIRGSDNVLCADFEDMATGGNHPVAGSTPIALNTWYHAAVTYDGTTWKIFLNGNLEATLVVGSSTPRWDSRQHAGLGVAMDTTAFTEGHFDGVMDEVRIWNFARGQDSIQASKNRQITIPQTGLVARYGFGEGSGTSIYCGAGATVNGTLSGSGASWITDSPFNSAPTASGVNITGTALVGQQLTSHYTYADGEGDLEGTSTFRWLADDVAIGGATASTYTLTINELGKSIKFEVTPAAQTGASPGLAVQSSAVGPVTAPGLTITATAGAHGSIDPSGDVSVEYGADKSFTITSDLNYRINTLIVDGSPVNPVSPYVFPNVTAGHTISVTFIQDIYPVAATGPVNIDLNGDGTTDMRVTFTKLPAGGGNVSPVLYLTPPAGMPVPPSGSLAYYLAITSTITSHAFMATVSVDMAGVTGFGPGLSLAYYNEGTSSWVLISGTYTADDPAFGGTGHPSFTFQTDHFTPFVFYDAGTGLKKVFVSADPAAAAPGVITPNNTWGPGTAYGANDWSWTGSQQVSVYIVPEAGLQFGAVDFTLEWDATLLNFTDVSYGAAGSPNGLFGSGHSYAVSTHSNHLGATNRVTINCTTLDGSNVTGAAGAYIARVNFTLLKPGHSAVALTGTDFRAFVDGGPMTAINVVPQQAEVRAYLGDVASNSTEAAGDGVIDFDDLVPWSYSYFSGTSMVGGNMENYMTKYDIGSAAGGYVFTLPTPDSKIDFEDLVIFSIAYGLNATSQLPKLAVASNEPAAVSLGQMMPGAGETRIPVTIEGDISDLRALHLEITGQFESFLGAEKGSLTQSYTSPVSILAKADGRNLQVDCAILGLGADGIKRPGEILVLRFAGNPRVHLAASMARSSLNTPLNIVSKAGAGDYQPVSYALLQNYPNPFNPTTVVSSQLPVASNVRIVIYDMVGREVKVLVNERREAGYYTDSFDASGLASGVYVYRFSAGSFTQARTMLLVK